MKHVALLSVFVCAIAVCAQAEYLTPPPWEGEPGAETFQSWEFPLILAGMPVDRLVPWPMPPFASAYPNGEGFIEWPEGWMDVPIEPYEPGDFVTVNVETTVQYVDDYVTPDGNPVGPGTPTVHIGVTNQDGSENNQALVPVHIWIPNNPDPNEVKKVWWQMTADKSATPQGDPPQVTPTGADPSTAVPPAHPTQAGGDNSVPGAAGSLKHGNSNWYTYSGLNEVGPNPEGEWLTFWLVNSTNIEEINIDTICTPEPGSMVLLAMGGLALLRRRRTV